MSEENDTIDELSYDLESEPSPAKPVSPLQFFSPGEDPVANRDFRPTAVTMTEEELDQVREDGQGNFKNSSRKVEPRHPSESRADPPYLNRDEVTEEPEGEQPQEASGIAGTKQVQPTDE